MVILAGALSCGGVASLVESPGCVAVAGPASRAAPPVAGANKVAPPSDAATAALLAVATGAAQV